MGFYYRKSLRAGPLRFNFSKAGVGVSVGVRGFRVGTGPRGNYVHMGGGGFYYRATLPSNSRPIPQQQNTLPQHTQPELRVIESADVLQLQDSSAADLLNELSRKHQRFQFSVPAAILSLAGILALIGLGVPWWSYVVAGFACTMLVLAARFWDEWRKTTVLYYDLEPEIEQVYQKLHNAFGELGSCSRLWHVDASAHTRNLQEWKSNAGASSIIRRNITQCIYKPPRFVSTNIIPPSITLGRQTLFFFPDHIFIYDGAGVGAIAYKDVSLQLGQTRFIEDRGVPRDAQIVGATWQHPNKGGGPDRRYKYNRQIPVALYGEFLLTSSTGLHKFLLASRTDAAFALSQALKVLAEAQSRLPKTRKEATPSLPAWLQGAPTL